MSKSISNQTSPPLSAGGNPPVVAVTRINSSNPVVRNALQQQDESLSDMLRKIPEGLRPIVEKHARNLSGELRSQYLELMSSVWDNINKSNRDVGSTSQSVGTGPSPLSQLEQELRRLSKFETRYKVLTEKLDKANADLSDIAGKSCAGAEAVDRLREAVNAIKQDVKDLRSEVDDGVAKAAVQADESVQAFLSKHTQRLEQAWSDVAKVKELSTVKALASRLEEKRKSEQKSMWWKTSFFYLSLLGFVVIGFLAILYTHASVTQEMLRQYGLAAYLVPIPKMLVRLAPFYIPLFWFACHFSRLAAQARRLMEEYAHKVVVATTYVGVADEVDSMIEMHITSAFDLRSELMHSLITTLSSNPNTSLDKVKNTTPISEVADCVARLAGSVKDVKGPMAN